MGLGVDLKGLNKSLVELNITDASFKKLEDEALDASEGCCLLGRVPREVVGKDSVRLVVKRTRESLFNPLSQNTLTNTSLTPKVERLVLAVEEAGQLALDPVASIFRAIKMLVDLIVKSVSD